MNLFKGLMFLEGHFARPEDLDDGLAPLGNHAAAGRRPHGPAAPALGLLENLQFLGGRPMHAGHNLDLDEPFEQLAEPLAAANDAHARRDCVACG